MNRSSIFLVALLGLSVVGISGCDDGITPGANMQPHPIKPSGTPEERIQRLESNPHLSEAKKQKYIADIKQKNNIK